MRTHFEYDIRFKRQRLADLKNETAELERQLSDARPSLEHELAQPALRRQLAAGRTRDRRRRALEAVGHGHDAARTSAHHAAPRLAHEYGNVDPGGQVHPPEDRTDRLVSHGRRGARDPWLTRGRALVLAVAVIAGLVAAVVTLLLSRQASWPASVTTVQSQAARACQNPDVQSEPGQVNFACADATRQILWVFALMTSGNNPDFSDTRTGRLGLEPITPAQGGVAAWSLNLHHPYDPFNPIDSLAVAARAINNIIGGATVTGADGHPVVQSGLESHAANCLRYTGSAALTSRQGFPSVCARPVASPAGQAALVADVYQKWVVGAAPRDAADAAVLFANAQNPGDPQVQVILNRLSNTTPAK